MELDTTCFYGQKIGPLCPNCRGGWNWGDLAAAADDDDGCGGFDYGNCDGDGDDDSDDDDDADDKSDLPTVGVVAADDSRELPVSDHHMHCIQGNTLVRFPNSAQECLITIWGEYSSSLKLSW